MRSKLTFKCSKCKTEKSTFTEEPPNENTKSMCVNTAVPLGTLSVGIGYTQFSEICGALDIPPMTKDTYESYETKVAKGMQEASFKEMMEAGQEERRLALEAGDVSDDGIPFITVVVDGSWAKRSYGANYSSLQGTVITIFIFL